MTHESFWTTASERHKRIAEAYYRNIETSHPDSVTSKRMCPCLEYCSWCGWAATSVEYPEYRGPRVTNL